MIFNPVISGGGASQNSVLGVISKPGSGTKTMSFTGLSKSEFGQLLDCDTFSLAAVNVSGGFDTQCVLGGICSVGAPALNYPANLNTGPITMSVNGQTFVQFAVGMFSACTVQEANNQITVSFTSYYTFPAGITYYLTGFKKG